MTRERAQKLSLMVYVPKRYLRIGGGREHEVAAIRHKSNLCDGLRMVFVCMEELLGYEVFDVAAVATKLDIEVYTLLDL